MQQALQTRTVVDDQLAAALSAPRPLLDRRVRANAPETSDSTKPTTKRMSFDEFLAFRLKRPDDVASVSLEAMSASVYIESSVISYLTSRPSRDTEELGGIDDDE